MSEEPKISFFNRTFWDLWFQKIFRNFASVKYQWLFLLYWPVIKGMLYDGHWVNNIWVPKIGVVEGLSFLGGGFITLAVSRLIARTKLTEDTDGNNENSLDTDN